MIPDDGNTDNPIPLDEVDDNPIPLDEADVTLRRWWRKTKVGENIIGFPKMWNKF